MSDRKATLTVDGGTPIELPVYKGTKGQDVIDVGTLGNHGHLTRGFLQRRMQVG